MRNTKLLLASVLPLVASSATAAEITTYGIVDIGPTYVSNQGGKSMTRMDAGTLQQSRLGFKGVEDLGGGLSAFFQLEIGYNLDTGTLATANTLFSRDARVGLKGGFGTISLGRQANATVDALAPYSAAMLGYGPSYLATHPGNHDRILNIPTDNSIKYATPSFAGLTAIVAYGFGEQAGDSRQNSTRNVALTYQNGAWSLGASYLWQSGVNVTNLSLLAPSANPFGATGASDVLRSAGIGASYKFAEWSFVHGNLTQSKFGISGVTARTLELGMRYQATDLWVLGGDYAYTRVVARADYDALAVSASYYFSKRTNLYITGALQNASGTTVDGAPLTAQLFTLGNSSTGRQRALHTGLRHVF
ncbi:porin [Massilia sp. METH4]|uniref:porin n=1 Tax=Massilia sp. METH4 TaxID=3123041 RepID=UPI0030CF5933